MASQHSVPPLISNASIFNIYHCDDNGRPDKKYDPDDAMYVSVGHCIKIAQASMKKVAVVLAFEGLATEVGRERPDAWFLHGEGTIQAKTVRKTKEFLALYRELFNTTFVDDSIKTLTCKAHHSRYGWTKNFDLREQPITLNGMLCQRMVAAAKLADPRDYRAFLFTISSCLLHEVSHVFVTYLTKGEEDTPTSICANVKASWAKTEVGESGLNMEQRIFGGVLALIRPTSAADPHKTCGIPYLITETGVYRIKQETIDRTVECDFKFPYDTSDNDESSSAVQMSDGQPSHLIKAPMEHPDWPKLQDAHPIVP